MELPQLGKHCSEKTCKQLDFLPVKCDACKNVFCTDHFSYSSHNCSESYKKDNQVPVCPLCNKPIPVPPGKSPDMMVGQHIDTDCQSDPAREKRGKIFSNKCSKKGCKHKELVPVNCEKCHKNYCLKHRFEMDHDCKGFQDSGRGVSKAGAAAASRVQPNNAPGAVRTPPSRPQHTNILSNIGGDLNRERRERQRALQGGMTEDEALAQAMAMSMSDQPGPPPSNSALSPEERRREQEAADAALALALQNSEQQNRGNNSSSNSRGRTNRQSSTSEKSSCQLS